MDTGYRRNGLRTWRLTGVMQSGEFFSKIKNNVILSIQPKGRKHD